MGYIAPPRPGDPPNPWIVRTLSFQIVMWLVAAPFLVVSVVVICWSLAT